MPDFMFACLLIFVVIFMPFCVYAQAGPCEREGNFRAVLVAALFKYYTTYSHNRYTFG